MGKVLVSKLDLDVNRRFEVLAAHIRFTDEVSFRLLGFVPLLSVAAIAAFLFKDEVHFSALLMLLSLFAAVVTWALFAWELRNIQMCSWCRERAAEIERDSGLPRLAGHFSGFPGAFLRLGKTTAEKVVYSSTVFAWLLLPVVAADSAQQSTLSPLKVLEWRLYLAGAAVVAAATVLLIMARIQITAPPLRKAMRRRPIIGVIGGGMGTAPPTSPTYELAKQIGELLATRGAIVLTGGGTGVMEAAMLGAKAGHTIGVLPDATGEATTQAEFFITTNLGDGRNYLNAYVSDVVIALAGEAGTLSEIALALKVGTPVICLPHWCFLEENGFEVEVCEDAEQAVDAAYRALGRRYTLQSDRTITAEVRRPRVPDQTEVLDALTRQVEEWVP